MRALGRTLGPVAAACLLAIGLAGCESAYKPDNSAVNANTSPIPAAADTSEPAPVTGAAPVPETGDKQIGEPKPAVSPLPPDAEAVRSAISFVHQYYEAINAGEFRKAYELWSDKGEASGQTFDEFRDSYANAASVRIDTSGEPGNLEGAAGSQYVGIPLLIYTKTKDGKEERSWGEYTLRRSFVEGAEPYGEWRIHSAQFRPLKP